MSNYREDKGKRGKKMRRKKGARKKAASAAFLPSFRFALRSARSSSGRRPLVAVALTEFLDATGRVHDLLLARVKRVTIRANFDVIGATQRRARFEGVAATARYVNLTVFRVNIGFHQSSFLEAQRPVNHRSICGRFANPPPGELNIIL
jgi:hypothetical protein